MITKGLERERLPWSLAAARSVSRPRRAEKRQGREVDDDGASTRLATRMGRAIAWTTRSRTASIRPEQAIFTNRVP